MNTQEHKDEQLNQSSRHLGEWSSNATIEVESRYVLGGKHRYEHSCLALGKIDSDERERLLARHLKEIIELKHSNSKVRLALEIRHVKERQQLNDLFA